MNNTCLFCGNQVQLVYVHGHYQCPVCNTNALPCCDGDNCNNSFLSEQIIAADNNHEIKNRKPDEDEPEL